ncbi:conserved hypothetical plastid protein (plastid) [Chondrus crispus]|uniref:Uncharacterized protein ycf20 n=1 Tax=Chondrus crispus TaxID=2769 RepID=M5DD41_CHOCR|nr:conserved hypothetical plastid protein [Chondrus crispus]CCP38210.1 conserved hypothetical plastid protein [Chondrus crispus]|eukprot:YP_007627463.1 conserved hypothetical plastid protein (plastid) [Chondrus crispus]
MKHISNITLCDLKYKIISLLLGFFISTALSTMPAQTGDWGIIGASIIVTVYEIASKLIYSRKNNILKIPSIINHIKIGIIYGIFVDAFKLGS